MTQTPKSFTVTVVRADADGGSYFDEMDVPLNDAGEIGWLSETLSANGVVFRWNGPDYNFDWHNAPRRQFIVLLDGTIEIEVTTGEKRTFGAGDVVLVEDTTGRGHKTRTVDGRPRRSLFIPCEPASTA